MQRRVDSFAIDPKMPGQIQQTSAGLHITWPDGAVSELSHALLESVANDYLSKATPLAPQAFSVADDTVLWPDPADSSVKPSEPLLASFLSDDAEFAKGIEILSRYGYLVLRGDQAEAQLAQQFADRIGYVRQTIFGGMWDLAAGLTEHADSAYTTIYLGPHTDATYSHDAPGLQFFLCLQRADRGGESLLVDGFAIARDLADSDPDAYATLCSVIVPGRYIEPGVHLLAHRPVFRNNHRGVLTQVSYNNYDRAPFLLEPKQEACFYQAYGRFAELANDPARRLEVDLRPGDLLVFDNWRSLHGRNEFSGPRHYVGAYLNHEDLESKRRVLLCGKG